MDKKLHTPEEEEYLRMMDQEVPDLWNRIEAGLDRSEQNMSREERFLASQEGEILSSRFAVTRRNRTIHARMRAYIRALMEEPQLETLLLPTGDGAAVSCKTTRSS